MKSEKRCTARLKHGCRSVRGCRLRVSDTHVQKACFSADGELVGYVIFRPERRAQKHVYRKVTFAALGSIGLTIYTGKPDTKSRFKQEIIFSEQIECAYTK